MNKLFAILVLAAVIAVASAQYYGGYYGSGLGYSSYGSYGGLGYSGYSSYGYPSYGGYGYGGLGYYKK